MQPIAVCGKPEAMEVASFGEDITYSAGRLSGSGLIMLPKQGRDYSLNAYRGKLRVLIWGIQALKRGIRLAKQVDSQPLVVEGLLSGKAGV